MHCLAITLLAVSAAVAATTPALPTNIRVWAIPDDLYSASGKKASGFFPALLDEVKKITGIPYTIEPHPELTHATPQGNFKGTILQPLIDNKADLVGPDLEVTSFREAVVDFCLPYAIYNVQLIVNADTGINADTQYLSLDLPDLMVFKLSSNATLKAIYDNIEKNRPSSIVPNFDYAGALQKVSTGNYAFIAESHWYKEMLADPATPKNLRIQDPNMGTFYLSIAVQQGSPLREVINRALEKLMENGTMRKLKQASGIELYNSAA